MKSILIFGVGVHAKVIVDFGSLDQLTKAKIDVKNLLK